MSKTNILKPFLDDEIINSFSVDFQYIRDKKRINQTPDSKEEKFFKKQFNQIIKFTYKK